MAISQEYLSFVLEQLQPLGAVTAKRMFGGACLFFRGLAFGLISEDVLFFKVDASNRNEYESAGMTAFQPFENKAYKMGYYEVPAEVIENPQDVQAWARKAISVAQKCKRKKKDKL